MNSNTFHNTCRNTSKYNESKNNCIEFQKKKKKKHRLIESPINYFHSQQNRTNVKRTAPPPPFEKKKKRREKEREGKKNTINNTIFNPEPLAGRKSSCSFTCVDPPAYEMESSETRRPAN